MFFMSWMRNVGLQFLQRIQSKLEFRTWSNYPAFYTSQGLGRIALISSMLTFFFTIYFFSFIILILYYCNIISYLPFLTTASNNNDDSSNNHNAIIVFQLIQWCTYMLSLLAFHLSEFYITAIYNPHTLSADSFMVNHSIAYTAAALTSWLEFWIRSYVFATGSSSSGSSSSSRFVFMVGLMLMILGHGLRIVAMVTCGDNFNHYIQSSRKENHVLVTHGIYKYLRHPSYVGFFYWSLGTQLTLGNHINFTLYSILSWRFFQSRILYEERTLILLFPINQEYEIYRRRTFIGIPFITVE